MSVVDEANEHVKNGGQSGLAMLPSGPAFVCFGAEERWMRAEHEEQERRCKEWERERREYLRELALEAERRGCDEDELEALWQGKATYIPDYDDHSSDDPRAEQNIVCELGMSIFNPFIERTFV